ncbi:unnamed protein product, partial [Ectocarpus fasciculatus]
RARATSGAPRQGRGGYCNGEDFQGVIFGITQEASPGWGVQQGVRSNRKAGPLGICCWRLRSLDGFSLEGVANVQTPTSGGSPSGPHELREVHPGECPVRDTPPQGSRLNLRPRGLDRPRRFLPSGQEAPCADSGRSSRVWPRCRNEARDQGVVEDDQGVHHQPTRAHQVLRSRRLHPRILRRGPGPAAASRQAQHPIP